MVFKIFRDSFHYSLNTLISWLIKLAAYFCQSLLITGRVYCQMIKVDWLTADILLKELAHCLQILPANEKLGLEADAFRSNPADQ
jgi:hypothetical protein